MARTCAARAFWALGAASLRWPRLVGATRELVRLQPAAAWARGQRSSTCRYNHQPLHKQTTACITRIIFTSAHKPHLIQQISTQDILCSVVRTVLAVFRRIGLASCRFSQICVYSPPFPDWPIFGDTYGSFRCIALDTPRRMSETHRCRRKSPASLHGPRSFRRKPRRGATPRPVYSLQYGDGRATGSRCSSAYERSTSSKSDRSAFGSASSSCSCSHPGGVGNAHKLPHFTTSQWAPDGGALCSHRAAKK